MKKCGRCLVVRPAQDFNRRGVDKLHGYCKDCAREYHQERTKARRLDMPAPPVAKLCKRCDLIKDAVTEFYVSAASVDGVNYYCKDCETDRHRVSLYGLSRDDVARMFLGQGKCCAICKSTTPRTTKDWHIDHCHTTNRVRGILCNPCNLMLGYSRDNPDVLRTAAVYLVA